MDSNHTNYQWGIVKSKWKHLEEDMEREPGSFACYGDVYSLMVELQELGRLMTLPKGEKTK